MTFLLLDLLFYYWHRANHVWPFLWRFHAVHHSDTEMDVSTTLRHHPVAYIMVGALSALTFAALGLPTWVISIYAALITSITFIAYPGSAYAGNWAELVPGFMVVGVIYMVENAHALPSFFPGHSSQPSTHHHVKHGIAALLLGLACLAFAWFRTGPRDRTATPA